MSLSYKIDYVGKKFNSLKIIGFELREGRNQYWKCLCDCGNETIVSIAHLKTGHTKTCGKCKWLNQKFGKLTVIEYTNKRTSDGHIIVKCQCECGNIVEKGVDTLVKNNLTQSCGCQKRSQGELLIRDILSKNKRIFIEEYTFDNLVGENNHKLRFDFAVFDTANNKIDFLIEFDGIQHFKNIDFFNHCEDTKKNDLIKNQYCKDHNIKLIRIPYYDIQFLNYDYLIDKYNKKE